MHGRQCGRAPSRVDLCANRYICLACSGRDSLEDCCTFCRWRKRRCACLFLSARTCLKDLPEPVLDGEPLLQPSRVPRLGPLPPPLSAFLSPLLWGELPYSAANSVLRPDPADRGSIKYVGQRWSYTPLSIYAYVCGRISTRGALIVAGRALGCAVGSLLRITSEAASKARLSCMRLGPSAALGKWDVVLHIEVSSLKIDVEGIPGHSQGCSAGWSPRVGWPFHGSQILQKGVIEQNIVHGQR